MSEALRLEEVRQTFSQGRTSLDVLHGVNLTIAPGEVAALVGPSGSGKSTLLHIAGLLQRPSEGRVAILGETASDQGDGARTELRRRRIGFVYQFHRLLPEFSAIENVMLPQMIAGVARAQARAAASELLTKVGLAARLEHRPAELSGGEQQRTAIVRALANRPALLLADEPTGNLDSHTADEVFEWLLQLVRERTMAALIVTHNAALAARTDRVLTLRDGRIVPNAG